MAKPTGFLEKGREVPSRESVETRIEHYREMYKDSEFAPKMTEQASRCMDCGVPFCHSGCPLGNIIPEFNDAVYRQDWAEAWDILKSTNNFPEFTGRICPAPCETACVLGINQPAVTIHNIERFIVERAYKEGWAKPVIPKTRTGKTIAVVGSGPAGLACAAQLNSAGHTVTVFERAEKIGGLVRYGIPDFKLEKWIVQRKVDVMEAEGVIFKTSAHIGVDVPTKELQDKFDVIVLSGGSTVPRDLPAKGREGKGVYAAMEFLSSNSSRVNGMSGLKNHRGEEIDHEIFATDRNVLVIGGGDTGSDCVGTSIRHKAKSVTQIEIMPKPPEERDTNMPWPSYPMVMRTSSSQEEGCNRNWLINTKEFIRDAEGNLKALKIVDVEWVHGEPGTRPQLLEKKETLREIPCELALLAMGFLHPPKEGLLFDLGVELDERGNVKADYGKHQTSVANVYACGDMRRGQSLVVWAITEGRECAVNIDEHLMGFSNLECKFDSNLHAH
jgi:glutamate synthase (NADPH/NADH) small chain